MYIQDVEESHCIYPVVREESLHDQTLVLLWHWRNFCQGFIVLEEFLCSIIN